MPVYTSPTSFSGLDMHLDLILFPSVSGHFELIKFDAYMAFDICPSVVVKMVIETDERNVHTLCTS